MFTNTSAKMLYYGLVALCLAACNLPVQAPVVSTFTQANELIATTAPRENLCANALFPVKKGAVWTYSNSSQTFGASSLTITITDVRLDGFTMVTKVGQDSPTQEWTCSPDGLLALSFGSGASVLDFATQGISGALAASNVSGITIPANVQPGMKWTYNVDVSGNITQTSNNMSANAKGTVQNNLQAVDIESVTVPAGTFQATKVQATSTFNVTANYHGLGIPLSLTINSTFWFAPGVGLVQSQENTSIAGTTYSASTELQSYNIP